MVNITGIIGEDIKLIDVISQVKSDSGDVIKVYINSPGGFVDEGLAVYRFLKNYEKPVHTICVGECSSIATIVFMAGEKRLAGCDLMIHNPWLETFGGYDSSGLKQKAEELDSTKKELTSIYSSSMDIDSDTLSDLMDNETFINPNDAVNIGFATGVYSNKPVAFFRKENFNNKKINKMSKEKKSIKDALNRLFNLVEGIKDLDLTDVNGNEFSVETESDTVQVGDAASPDGIYTMENGDVITITDGVIASIEVKSEEEPEGEEVALLKTEIGTLVASVDGLVAAVENAQNLKKEVEEKSEKIITVFKKLNAEKDALMALKKKTSTYTPKERDFSKKTNQTSSIKDWKEKAKKEKIK